jgi:hypothetical protein
MAVIDAIVPLSSHNVLLRRAGSATGGDRTGV